MKWKRVLVVVLSLLFSGVGVFFILIVLTEPNPPKEAVLIKNFHAQKATYERLRDMIMVDTNLIQVASWGVETHKPSFRGYPTEQNFSTNRFHEYLALLKDIKAMDVARNRGEPADPSILIWAWGFAGNTHHIGVVWLEEPPKYRVPSLDDFHSSEEHPTAFQHIESNWYLWTDL